MRQNIGDVSKLTKKLSFIASKIKERLYEKKILITEIRTTS